jgi:glutamate-ammonia-ligase adenylyltransferase
MSDEAFDELMKALEPRVDDPDRLERLVDRLAQQLPTHVDGGALAGELRPLLEQSAAPAEVLLFLVRLAQSDAAEAVFDELDDVSVFVELARQGAYPARTLLRHPEDLSYLSTSVEGGLARDVSSLVAELDERLSDGGDEFEQRVHRELRRLKRRESLRIFLREVRGQASLRETTHEIAALAEACLRCSVERGAEALGRPGLVDHFCVFGMGKLGGRELNFSSDVDLIYMASPDASADAELAEALDRLAKWVTAAMEVTGEGGYVFRVDLRLRPEGSKGPLVPTLDAMEEYYQSWGRTWERSAMLKARPVAGNLAMGEELLDRLQSFLYRKYLDFGVIDELRGMKEKINQNARAAAHITAESDDDAAEEPPSTESSLKSRLRAKMKRAGVRDQQRRGRAPRLSSSASTQQAPETSEPEDDHPGLILGWDVKIGVGGIREIEFFVQALQLIHCGTRPHLRVRGTLDALDRLLYAGLISHEDHAVLADAYDLFRRVEHRIQMEHDRQSHRISTDRGEFEKLARRLFVEPTSLENRLVDYRQSVSEMFQRLFEESEQRPEKPTVGLERSDELATVFGAPLDRMLEAPVLDALESLGFNRPRQVAGQVQVLREKDWSPFGGRSSSWQTELANYVVLTCAEAPNPDQAFSFWTRLVTAVGDRPGFFKMLYENPHATRLLMLVLGSSQFLGSIVVREPNVIEYALGAGTVALVRERDAMSDELERRLRGIVDPSHRLGRLRRFQQEETLRIALHEIAGACELEETVEQLSILAEVCLEGVLREVYEGLREGKGSEAWPRFEALPFTVLAMGKLGGRELGFGSDLDIIFVYEPLEDVGLDHQVYAKLAQRLVRQLSSVSEQGKLYEVDTRLRPSGRQGTLVVSLEAFREYHRANADLWERQALIRARPVSGPRALCDAVMDVRAERAFASELPGDAREQFCEMRDKISEHLSDDSRQFNIKASPGGLLDVEFMTQYLQLTHGKASAGDATSESDWLAEGVRSQNTIRALVAIDEFVDQIDGEAVARDYEMLRRVEARLRVADLRDHNVVPADSEERTMLARRLGYQGEDAAEQLAADVDAAARRIRSVYERAMGI